MRFLITAAVNAVALWVATILLSGVRLDGAVPADSFLSGVDPSGQRAIYFLLAGGVLGVVNMLVRPIVKVLSLPFYVLTLGLFFIIVNALMISLTAWVTGMFDLSLTIDGFWWAVGAGIVVGVVNWFLSALLPDRS
ncbi:phage holin family protein [Trueperella bialowiezensis]|uniref:Membrane protein of uncharacterized function n=1 Tax=Trueperella bialowiezensis TaxID=312285 RepID=A0A3S4VTM7_9ACTO|nr:phage holin family protein [Trueperella bialowiezensis]VEI13465.1 Membrane protein of uncharacterised function [Trueperella bialowiezensis]